MHLGKYTKEELKVLKKKGVKPHTKSAHEVFKKKYRMSEGGYMKKNV